MRRPATTRDTLQMLRHRGCGGCLKDKVVASQYKISIFMMCDQCGRQWRVGYLAALDDDGLGAEFEAEVDIDQLPSLGRLVEVESEGRTYTRSTHGDE